MTAVETISTYLDENNNFVIEKRTEFQDLNKASEYIKKLEERGFECSINEKPNLSYPTFLNFIPHILKKYEVVGKKYIPFKEFEKMI